MAIESSRIPYLILNLAYVVRVTASALAWGREKNAPNGVHLTGTLPISTRGEPDHLGFARVPLHHRKRAQTRTGPTLACALHRERAPAPRAHSGLKQVPLAFVRTIPRSRSVAHLVVVPEASVPQAELRPVSEVHGLVFDHDDIIELAVRTLRAAYRAAPTRSAYSGRSSRCSSCCGQIAGGPRPRQ